MALTTAPDIATPDNAPNRPLLRQANRVWRRSGVLKADRHLLIDELSDELQAARSDDRSVSDVVGQIPRETFREWAIERGVSGRSLRLGLLGPLTLACVALGSLVIIVENVVTFTIPGPPLTHPLILLAALINGVASSLIMPTLACWAVLHRGGDPRAGATARWLLACLPIGALIAVALAFIAAAITGYDGRWIPLLGGLIALSFLAATASARLLATRYSRAH